ncbi:MAG TPA: protein kinase, partial [Kofleriaceae bacterium]|nr:protein kinase [Kofleriaceae bacterium]
MLPSTEVEDPKRTGSAAPSDGATAADGKTVTASTDAPMPGPPPMPDAVPSTMPTMAPPPSGISTLPPPMPAAFGPPPMPGDLPPTIAPPSSGSSTLPPPMPGTVADTAPGAIMPTLAGNAVPATARPPSMPPPRYELGAEIARGGMGRVVEATDTVLGRVVALKEVLAADEDTLQRFARETRITARLEHPSIVPLHDAGTMPGGAPYYVMRKISGRPLERLVALAETLPQRLVLIPHIVDAAQAIAHAHERGIVHRDIKPSNILVGDLGETIVIDWGLAKVIGEADDAPRL